MQIIQKKRIIFHEVSTINQVVVDVKGLGACTVLAGANMYSPFLVGLYFDISDQD